MKSESANPQHIIHELNLKPQPQTKTKESKPDICLLFTGMTAGIFARTATHPLERIRIMQQTGSPEYTSRSVYRSLRYMLRTEGPAGMFRGNGLNIMLQSPFTAFEFFFYDFYKKNLFKRASTGAELAYHEKVICGGLTGITAAFLTYPMDVVKTYNFTRNAEKAGRQSVF